jgi:membrane-bound lytic murein transglycosylase D
MKLLHILSLTLLVWLTGCASTAVTSQSETGANYTLTEPVMASDIAPTAMERKRSRSANLSLRPITAAKAGSNAVAQLTPPADLWERMRLGFSMPDLESDIVSDREQWYTARPDYILRMTERSRKYLFYIVEELERRNMPTELALLPFVESAFNPQAVSSAKAAGMWQFMPATGKTFSLKQTAFRDDRRDVQASTRAALDYMQKLYGMFGDWQLVLAAYNWGEGSVGRAIAKNQRAGLGLSYSELSMPNETRYYVPKLQALKNIISNPDAFNSQLPHIGNHPYFQSVDLKHDIDVALAAKLAEVPLEDFKALNPAASRSVIFASGTPQILLPWDNVAIFLNNLETYSGNGLASWTVWQAPTTLKTAEAAKRVGMSESELRSANNIPAGMLIKAGSSLLVKRSPHLDTDVTLHLANNGQLSLAPDVVLKRTLLKAGKKDTVASVAERHRVSPASLAEWNKVNVSAAFKAGQPIVLFLPVQARTSPGKSSAQSKTVEKTGQPQARNKNGKASSVTHVAKASKVTKKARVAKR